MWPDYSSFLEGAAALHFTISLSFLSPYPLAYHSVSLTHPSALASGIKFSHLQVTYMWLCYLMYWVHILWVGNRRKKIKGSYTGPTPRDLSWCAFSRVAIFLNCPCWICSCPKVHYFLLLFSLAGKRSL